MIPHVLGIKGKLLFTCHYSPDRTQQHYHRPEKSGSDTIKGEGDTALEAEAQLYSDNIDLKIMQVKVIENKCKVIRPAK